MNLCGQIATALKKKKKKSFFLCICILQDKLDLFDLFDLLSADFCLSKMQIKSDFEFGLFKSAPMMTCSCGKATSAELVFLFWSR